MSLGSQSSVSIDGGTGAPDDDNPANPQGGDIYVDETSGDIYTYSGDQWTNKSEVVSEEEDNVIQEDENGLAFLNKSEFIIVKK